MVGGLVWCWGWWLGDVVVVLGAVAGVFGGGFGDGAVFDELVEDAVAFVGVDVEAAAVAAADLSCGEWLGGLGEDGVDGVLDGEVAAGVGAVVGAAVGVPESGASGGGAEFSELVFGGDVVDGVGGEEHGEAGVGVVEVFDEAFVVGGFVEVAEGFDEVFVDGVDGAAWSGGQAAWLGCGHGW